MRDGWPLVGMRWAGMATVLGRGQRRQGGQQQHGGPRRADEGWPLVWRLLDHTEPQSVSLACASSLTKPEPEPSHLASQLREDTRAAPARPMNSLHMGPAVQHAAARVHVHLHHVVAAPMASLRCAWDAWRAACPGAAPGPFHGLHSRSGGSCACELSLACLPMSMPTRSHHRFIQQAQPVQRAHLRPSASASSVCGSETRDQLGSPRTGSTSIGTCTLIGRHDDGRRDDPQLEQVH